MAKIIIGIIIGVLIVLSIIYRKQVKDGLITVKAFFQKIAGKIKSRKK